MKSFFVAVILFGMLFGYVFNIAKIIVDAVIHSPVSTMFILRIVGIFVPPLGMILGWF